MDGRLEARVHPEPGRVHGRFPGAISWAFGVEEEVARALAACPVGQGTGS